MKNIIFFFCFSICVSSLSAQNWQQVHDIVEFPTPLYVRAFEFQSEDYGAVLSLFGGTNGPGSNGVKIEITKDAGLTWDSTIFNDVSYIPSNSLQIPSDSVIYFAFNQNVITAGQPTYVKRGVKRSFDQGVSWTTHWIDSLLVGQGQDPENNLVFLNDSMGVYIRNGYAFYTSDYGENWSIIYSSTATNAGVTDNKFILYNYGFLHVYDPFSNFLTSMPYSANCEGQVDFSDFKDQAAYRVLYAQDGTQQGYSANNYSVVIIDELPFGDQRVVHFPNTGYFTDLELSENGIFLPVGGWMYRSMDDGVSFQKMPLLNSITGIRMLSMINDTAGYALCSSPGIAFDPNYTLWKTTNGGGLTGETVVINSFIGGVGLDESNNSKLLEVFPNPSNGVFQIESELLVKRVELFSVEGKRCFYSEVDEFSFKMNPENIEIGVYFLKVYTDFGSVTKKIRIQ